MITGGKHATTYAVKVGKVDKKDRDRRNKNKNDTLKGQKEAIKKISMGTRNQGQTRNKAEQTGIQKS